jgi:hypothetical protein
MRGFGQYKRLKQCYKKVGSMLRIDREADEGPPALPEASS